MGRETQASATTFLSYLGLEGGQGYRPPFGHKWESQTEELSSLSPGTGCRGPGALWVSDSCCNSGKPEAHFILSSSRLD